MFRDVSSASERVDKHTKERTLGPSDPQHNFPLAVETSLAAPRPPQGSSDPTGENPPTSHYGASGPCQLFTG